MSRFVVEALNSALLEPGVRKVEVTMEPEVEALRVRIAGDTGTLYERLLSVNALMRFRGNPDSLLAATLDKGAPWRRT